MSRRTVSARRITPSSMLASSWTVNASPDRINSTNSRLDKAMLSKAEVALPPPPVSAGGMPPSQSCGNPR